MAYLCKGSRCNRVLISLYFLDLVNFTMPKYAVAKGRQIGVYDTWDECKIQTQGFNGARYKKFDTQKEAEDFIKEINGGSTIPKPKVKNSTMTAENLNSNKTDIFPVSKISPSNTLLHDFNNRLNIMESKLSNFMDSVNSALDNLKKRISSLEDKRTIEEQTSELESENDRIINGTESKGTKRKAESEENMNFDYYEKDDDVNNEESTINSTDSILPKQKKTKLEKCKILDEVDGYDGISLCVVNSRGFLVNPFGAVVVYTDGACTNNGKVSAKAGIGVWFNHSHPLNVCAPVRGRATNNNAEIQAATAAIRQASKEGIRLLHIYTDSKFLINCITEWIFKWKRNNWKTSEGKPVINKVELVELDNCINDHMESVIWTYVKGHSGEIGNTAADELARAGARLYVINK